MGVILGEVRSLWREAIMSCVIEEKCSGFADNSPPSARHPQTSEYCLSQVALTGVPGIVTLKITESSTYVSAGLRFAFTVPE